MSSPGGSIERELKKNFSKISAKDAARFVQIDDQLKKLARYLQPFFWSRWSAYDGNDLLRNKDETAEGKEAQMQPKHCSMPAPTSWARIVFVRRSTFLARWSRCATPFRDTLLASP